MSLTLGDSYAHERPKWLCLAIPAVWPKCTQTVQAQTKYKISNDCLPSQKQTNLLYSKTWESSFTALSLTHIPHQSINILFRVYLQNIFRIGPLFSFLRTTLVQATITSHLELLQHPSSCSHYRSYPTPKKYSQHSIQRELFSAFPPFHSSPEWPKRPHMIWLPLAPGPHQILLSLHTQAHSHTGLFAPPWTHQAHCRLTFVLAAPSARMLGP